MIDLYPKIYGTMTSNVTFASFKDSEGRFKIFDGDESPTTETPFITIEFTPGGQDQRTDWQGQIAMFHCTGKATDTATLWTLANAIRDLFKNNTVFFDGITYQVIGDADFAQSRNPLTEHRIVTVALQFGMV